MQHHAFNGVVNKSIYWSGNPKLVFVSAVMLFLSHTPQHPREFGLSHISMIILWVGRCGPIIFPGQRIPASGGVVMGLMRCPVCVVCFLFMFMC